MTSRADHYREAEQLLDAAAQLPGDTPVASATYLVLTAQVHATLATVSDVVAPQFHAKTRDPQ